MIQSAPLNENLISPACSSHAQTRYMQPRPRSLSPFREI